MNTNNSPVIWTIVIGVIIMVILGFMGVGSIKNALKETAEGIQIDIPAAEDISIPTADEIADAIAGKIDLEVLTGPQVKDNEKQIALDLVLEEMEDDDFLEDVMDEINSEIGDGYRYIDDEDDMTIVVKPLDEDETEVDLLHGENAKVTIEFVVYFLEDGEDDECGKARLQVQFRVSDLDRDNEYDDAEVSNRDYLTVETLNDPRASYCSRIA